MVSYKIPPDQSYMYIRKKYVYLKKTAEIIRKFKRKFNLEKEFYVFINKTEEDRCRKPLILYQNRLETENFERRKKEILSRNETSKCKITFSKTANAEFDFLIHNAEFNERSLITSAHEMKMSLHEFMAYYNHEKKLRMEAKARQQVVRSQHKHTAAKRRTMRENKETKKIPQRLQERLHFHAHSNPVEDIHSFTEKIKSSKIASVKKKKEIIPERDREDLHSYPEVLPEEKIHTLKELRVCLTNIDMQVSRMQHTCTHTAAKRKIEEKTMKISRRKLSPVCTEKNKKKNPEQHEKVSKPLTNIQLLKEKIKNREINAPNQNIEKFCKKKNEKKDDLHLYINPEELSEEKIQEDPYTSPKKIDIELSSLYTSAESVCVANTDVEVKSHVQHTYLQNTTAEKEINKRETKRTMEIPQNVSEGLYFYIHPSTEKNKKENFDNLPPPFDASEKEITVLHPEPLFPVDHDKEIHYFEEKIEISDIAAILNKNTENEFCIKGVGEVNENIQEDLPHVCAHPVTEESAGIEYISAETVCVTNTDMQVNKYISHVHHTRSHTATKMKVEEEGEKEISQSDSVDRPSFDMYGTEENNKKNKNVNLHTTPDSSDDEITGVLAFGRMPQTGMLDQPEKLLNSVEDIQHVFQSTEIADASSDIIPEDTLHHYFSEKLVGIHEDLHTYIEESSGGIPVDPHVCANTVEEKAGVCLVPEDTPHAVECENVPDDDLGYLLPENYVHDTFQRDEISGGYFSLNFLPLSQSKQYEDISNDCILSLPDDHTYDVDDNDAPCSVEDQIPVLQRECIVESAPTLSDVKVHPPLNNKKKKENYETTVFGTFDKVRMPLPSKLEDSDTEVVGYNKYRWKEQKTYRRKKRYPCREHAPYLKIKVPKNANYAPNCSIKQEALKLKYRNSKRFKWMRDVSADKTKEFGTLNKKTVSQPVIEVITLSDDDDDEGEVKNIHVSEYPSKQNYSNNFYQIHQPPSYSVPKYNDNYGASCSVKDEVHILQHKNRNEFKCVHNVSANKKESIVESLSAPTSSGFIVYPPLNNEVDKTMVFDTLNKVTVSQPSMCEDSDDVIICSDDDECEVKNIYVSEYPSKQNYSNIFDQLHQPPSYSVPKSANYGPSCSVKSRFAPILSDVKVHPPHKVKKKRGKAMIFDTLNKVIVSLPSVHENSDEEVVVFNENEWEEKDMYEISEYPLKQNYQYSNNYMQICPLPSNSVPEYNAASFYDIISSDVLV